MYRRQARENALRGMMLLDREIPGWWRPDRARPIDLDTLDLASFNNCILGQLGGYRRLRQDLDLAGVTHFDWHREVGRDVRYGFNVEMRWTLWGSLWQNHHYRVLTRAWKRIIKDRRRVENSVATTV